MPHSVRHYCILNRCHYGIETHALNIHILIIVFKEMKPVGIILEKKKKLDMN